MAFDLSTAKPVAGGPPPSPGAAPDAEGLAPRAGFDLSTAKPVSATPATATAAPPRATPSADPYAYYDPSFRREHNITEPLAGAGTGIANVVRDARNDPTGTAEAAAAGLNRGAIQFTGILGDTAQNLIDIPGIAYSATRSAITGEDPNDLYTVPDRANLPLTGDWNARMLEKAQAATVGGLPVTQNPRPENSAARLLYATGQAVPGAMTGRAMLASAAGGAAQGIVAEAGGDPALQALAGLAGNKAGETHAAPRGKVVAGSDTATAPAALTASGAPRALPSVAETPAPRELTATGAPRAGAYTDLEGAASSRKAPKFADETPVADNGAKLGLGDQARRADILRRAGVTELRNSAVQGDAKSAATDYQMSKLDSPQGQHMARVMNSEREAVTSFADQIAQDTGGTRGTGQAERYQRGKNIMPALDGISGMFDDGIKKLYGIADQRAKGKPFDTAKVREIVGDESEFLGTVEGEALLRGTKARMKSLGMTAPDGTPQRTTVQQAERLKQYLGNQWTPRTSRLIKSLKDAVDDDVLGAAGEDVYKRARALRASKAQIMEDPQGIAKIMDAEGPKGINRAVDFEHIGDSIASMPVDQFAHVVRVLNEAPAELRGQAQTALAEIKSQFANKLAEIGNKTATQWNAKGVSKYLNDNSARLRVLFSPSEIRRFADLNDAGHILRFDSSYPGAAVQAANLKRSAVLEHGATAAGGAVGGMMGGPLGVAAGAAVGKMVGGKAARRMNENAGLKAARARTMDLRAPGNALGISGPPSTNALQRD